MRNRILYANISRYVLIAQDMTNYARIATTTQGPIRGSRQNTFASDD